MPQVNAEWAREAAYAQAVELGKNILQQQNLTKKVLTSIPSHDIVILLNEIVFYLIKRPRYPPP
jgi:hypothetical protein